MSPETTRLLRRLGYFASLARHGRGDPKKLRPLPDLSTPGPMHPSLGTGFGVPTPRRKPLPEDAKQFPVGNSHKQGLELITPGSKISDYNGAKK